MTLAIAKQHVVLIIQGKLLSAIVANIGRFDNVEKMIDYMNKQRRCKECKKKANFMSEKCDASLHPSLQLNFKSHYVPTTPEGLNKDHPITGKVIKFLFLFLVQVLFTLIIVNSGISIQFFLKLHLRH